MFIYYTFLAGWCAESAGARLEFENRRFTDKEVDDAMHMTGISLSGIYPGQITDDSEMEIALLSALIKGKKEEIFPIEYIAEKYIEWYKTIPFDIGQSTSCALYDAVDATDMVKNALEYNMESQSNGSLMRCIPLAVFGIHKDNTTIMNIAMWDAELTLPNPLVSEITGLYCILIAEILREKINGRSPNKTDILQTVEQFISDTWVNELFIRAKNMTNEEITQYDSIEFCGHVKHAFIYVIYFFSNIESYTYEQAISIVIRNGGDTDTNAKIVGNMFGAYYGDCVPEYMSQTVLSFECENIDNPFFKRPYSCSIEYALELINRI